MPRGRLSRRKFFKVTIEGVNVYVFSLSAKDLVRIGYISIRGIDEEKAAVQRIFSKKRVKDVSEFIVGGGRFFSPFIINWNHEQSFTVTTESIVIPNIENAAQLIDGQHRLRGIEEAFQEKGLQDDFEVVVVMTDNLDTKDAARIFTNINSKQQSVSRSLIYDLFTELSNDPNHDTIRAHDIALELNTNPESPYFERIKFPGKSTKRGMLDLSTVIDSLRGHLGAGGEFQSKNISSLEIQKRTVVNFFSAIQLAYDEIDLWNSVTKNPFLGAAGFRAGVEVLTSTVLDRAASKSSLTVNTFKEILALDSSALLTKDSPEFKSLGGKEQVKKVIDFLRVSIHVQAPDEEEYEL